jgi:ADP-ribose pyrophosphatase YjhB (NUDIX family)
MKKAVAGIIVFENKILIGKKVVKEGHFLSGGWHIPGGHLHKNESERNALLREIKEETNLSIKIIKKICSHEIPENDIIVSWYLCSTNSCITTPGDDLDHIDFVKKNMVIKKCDQRAVRLWPKEVIDYFIT